MPADPQNIVPGISQRVSSNNLFSTTSSGHSEYLEHFLNAYTLCYFPCLQCPSCSLLFFCRLNLLSHWGLAQMLPPLRSFPNLLWEIPVNLFLPPSFCQIFCACSCDSIYQITVQLVSFASETLKVSEVSEGRADTFGFGLSVPLMTVWTVCVTGCFTNT